MNPHRNKSGSTCTAVLIANRAHPEWIQVSCKDKISNSVICRSENKTNVQSSTTTELTKHTYTQSCILKHKTCFLFKWQRQTDNLEQMFVQKDTVKWSFGDFTFLLDAVQVEFPPLFTFDMMQAYSCHKHPATHQILWKKILNISEALYIISEKSKKIVQGGNIFHCAGGAYISVLNVCDDQDDCSDDGPSDESGCECNSTSEYPETCKFVIDSSGNRTCSLFYRSSGNKSECFTFNFRETHITPFDREKIPVICANGQQIPGDLVNDMIADCGSNAEDESQLLSALLSTEVKQCSQHTQIPCRKFLAVCYNISQICSYRLNEYDRIIPCSTGEHLQNCAKFECNMLHKCMKFYCVPWEYVCDGKWDCPDGTDEFNNTWCLEHLKCKNFFKCRDSQVCLHLGEVCDRDADCPLGDDEHLCFLHSVSCPSNCRCLTYVLRCHDIQNKQLVVPSKVPYHIFSISRCTEYFIQTMLMRATKVVAVTLKDNNLKHICFLVRRNSATVLIDAAYNNLTNILDKCFDGGGALKSIQLNDNNITNVQDEAFACLPQLLFINLQRNLLVDISSQMTSNSPLLKLVNIQENVLSSVSKLAFENLKIEVLLSNNYSVCCLVPSPVICPAAPQWPKSCQSLLLSVSVKVAYYCVSVFIFVCAIVSVILQKCSSQKDKSKAFQITVGFLNITDLLCVTYLCCLWISDLHFKESFVLKQKEWTSGTLCFAACGIFVCFSWLSPALLSLVSLSRLMVVIHPLDTRVKKASFITKIVALFFSVGLVLTTTVSVTLKLVRTSVPNVWCSPFFDPENKTILIQITVWLTVILLVLTFVLMLVVHVLLVINVEKNRKKLAGAVSRKTSSKSTVVQVLIASASNALCWIPSSTIFLVCVFLVEFPVLLMPWTIASVSTINSIFIPVVLIVTTIRKIVS